MRVIAGSARGRTLTAPPGRSTRPTSDRVREALFSSLSDEIPAATVLDLFAGSGALGIEALSRGAEFVVFVDDDRRAVRTIVTNLSNLRLRACAKVVEVAAARFCMEPRTQVPFDVVLADPPYATPLPAVMRMLGDLVRAGGLRPGGLVVVERDKRDPDLGHDVEAPFDHLRDRAYGDTVLRYLSLREEPR